MNLPFLRKLLHVWLGHCWLPFCRLCFSIDFEFVLLFRFCSLADVLLVHDEVFEFAIIVQIIKADCFDILAVFILLFSALLIQYLFTLLQCECLQRVHSINCQSVLSCSGPALFAQNGPKWALLLVQRVLRVHQIECLKLLCGAQFWMI